MEFWIELVVSVFLVAGAVFVFIGSLGLAKLPDFILAFMPPQKRQHSVWAAYWQRQQY